jgi:prepilin-type N-terminal cleavage/methylation domain-containing protein
MLGKVRGFTLIELLVVVALIGVLSAIGVTYYSGFKESSERKQAETTMQSIYLAQQEYKSNNGSVLISSNTTAIVQNLFDGVDDLTEQNYTFTIVGNASAGTFCIRATKTGQSTLYLNNLKKKTNC